MSDLFSEIFPNSKSCVFQWNYPVINLGRNEYRNCCRSIPNKSTPDDLEKYGSHLMVNSPAERENRARMLLGEKVPTCISCWRIEEKNVQSPRKSFISSNSEQLENLKPELDQIKNHEDKVAYLKQHDLTFSKNMNMLEIILSNTCDMQCMYCSHHYSSRWAAERIKYGDIKNTDISSELPRANSQFKDQFNIWFLAEACQTVQHVNFIGGEPTLINDFYDLSLSIGKTLKEKSRQRVPISIVTNLNSKEVVFDRFINHIKELSKYYDVIDINVSIEAYGAKAEYIRDGLNWVRWKNNLERLLQLKLPQVCISAQMATNILSLSSLEQLIQFFGGLIAKYKVPIGLRQNLVIHPEAHSPMLLTPDFCKYIDRAVEQIQVFADHADSILGAGRDYGSWKKYIYFLNRLSESIRQHHLNDAEKKLIRNFFNPYNSRRQLDIYRTFPEYSNFLKICGVSRSDKMKGLPQWIQKLSNMIN